MYQGKKKQYNKTSPRHHSSSYNQPRQGGESDTSWNEVAKWYDTFIGDLGGKFHQDIIAPEIFSLLELKPGMKILDLGCGQGYLSRMLSDKKDLKLDIVAVDKSAQLISFAKKRGENGIKYLTGDATNLNFLGDQKFDRIVCVLAIQNMDPLDKVFKEANKHLVDGGKFVYITTHPAFRIPRQSGWGNDEGRKLQYRRVDSYMSEMKIPIIAHPGSKMKIATWTFHRPLQSYFNAMMTNGFNVDALHEQVSNKVSQPGAWAKAENRARNEIPIFISIRCVKVSNA